MSSGASDHRDDEAIGRQSIANARELACWVLVTDEVLSHHGMEHHGACAIARKRRLELSGYGSRRCEC